MEGFVAEDFFRRRLIAEGRAGEDFWPVPPWDVVTVEVLEEARPVWWPPQDGDTVLLGQLLNDGGPSRYTGLPRTRRDGKWWGPGDDTTSLFHDDDMVDAALVARGGEPFADPKFLV